MKSFKKLSNRSKINGWVQQFSSYRKPPNERDIEKWLSHFQDSHKPVAEKILNHVKLVSESEILEGYRTSLSKIDGWNLEKTKRNGRWFFCGYARSPHESGPAMLRKFSEANRINSDKYSDLFVTASDLPRLQLTSQDTLVFVDDFSGTGDQATKYWPILSELIASDARTFLILTAATVRALQEISRKTTILVVPQITLDHSEDIFSDLCGVFSQREKKIILEYCKIADRKAPKGYGNCGLIFVLSHKTPNNTIPILHVNRDGWHGLFPRYL